jgi:hypothetical protein
MGRSWVVLAHCVFVVVSMAAIPLLLTALGLVALFGFGSYIMFAFVEMLQHRCRSSPSIGPGARL